MEPTNISGYILPDSSNEQNLSLVVKSLYKKNTLLYLINRFYIIILLNKLIIILRFIFSAFNIKTI